MFEDSPFVARGRFRMEVNRREAELIAPPLEFRRGRHRWRLRFRNSDYARRRRPRSYFARRQGPNSSRVDRKGSLVKGARERHALRLGYRNAPIAQIYLTRTCTCVIDFRDPCPRGARAVPFQKVGDAAALAILPRSRAASSASGVGNSTSPTLRDVRACYVARKRRVSPAALAKSARAQRGGRGAALRTRRNCDA